MTLPSAVPAGLETYLREQARRVEEALRAEIDALDGGIHANVREAMRYALEARGKRLRPILVIAAYHAACRAGDAVPASAYRLSVAVEVVHTYSLVHDDLPCMDDDDLRRGRPTTHRAHGIPIATVAGAALIPLAFAVLTAAAAELRLTANRTRRLAVELARAAGAGGMVGGQWLDLEGETNTVDAAALERIHRAKTGALLATSLRIGAIAAGATDTLLLGLTAYGEALGLAFQIADDVLDVTGSTEALGKTAGKDENVGKATYPSLFGLAGAQSLALAKAEAAVAALRDANVQAPELEALARYVVERRH